MSAATTARPEFLAVDHVSRTVPALAAAIKFYEETFGARLLFQLGPIDGEAIPADEHGRDWMAAHVGVPGACLTLAMLQLTPNLKLQLIQCWERGPRSRPDFLPGPMSSP